MIINDLDGCYIVFDTKNRNMELDTLINKFNVDNNSHKAKLIFVLWLLFFCTNIVWFHFYFVFLQL